MKNPRPDPPQTPESIASAKRDAALERQKLEKLSGVRIDDDGKVTVAK